MILDSSAVVAVIRREPGCESLIERIAVEAPVGIGAPTLTETGIVLVAGLGALGRTLLARFLSESETEIVPFTDEHWAGAVDAFARFGKGRHPAGLTFGDCMTYAVARLADEPLLALGDEFAQTDLTLA